MLASEARQAEGGPLWVSMGGRCGHVVKLGVLQACPHVHADPLLIHQAELCWLGRTGFFSIFVNDHSAPAAGVVLQVDFFILDVTPQSIDKDVDKGPTASLQADFYFLAVEQAGEVDGGEPCTSFPVEIVGLAKGFAPPLPDSSRRSWHSCCR